jgi:phage terminase large subunit GpA-like protein
MLKWESLESPSDCAKTAYMVCPANGCYIKPEDRYEMNLRGKWLREGQRIDKHGVITGTGLVSEIASFWLKGVAAAFTTWQNLVKKMLDAELDYARTGSIEALKTTVNTDQGEPFFPRGMESMRLAEDIQSQALDLPQKKVPADVRALFATCDVQKNRWEVQVHGVKPGNPYDLVVIDRFAIVKSNRVDEDGERLWVKPSDHPEDWDLLVTEVMEKTYPLADGSGHMRIATTVCDSGGKEGVTGNAYLFYMRLKKRGIAERFFLCKGDSNPNAPRVRIEFPDSDRKDRLAKARGEVPVMMFNPNMLKDTLNGMLPNEEENGRMDEAAKVNVGRITFPSWLPDSFFEELTVEVRTPKGWENKHARRNESWDLAYYCIGLCTFRRIEHVKWSAAPPWLSEWPANPLVVLTQKTSTSVERPASRNLASLGEALG